MQEIVHHPCDIHIMTIYFHRSDKVQFSYGKEEIKK